MMASNVAIFRQRSMSQPERWRSPMAAPQSGQGPSFLLMFPSRARSLQIQSDSPDDFAVSTFQTKCVRVKDLLSTRTRPSNNAISPSPPAGGRSRAVFVRSLQILMRLQAEAGAPPTIVNSSVGRTQEYLTGAEVERLITPAMIRGRSKRGWDLPSVSDTMPFPDSQITLDFVLLAGRYLTAASTN
jgi:hypothetical protein